MNKMPTIKYCILNTEWESPPKGSKPHSYGEPFSNVIDFVEKRNDIINRILVNTKLTIIKITKNKYSVFQ